MQLIHGRIDADGSVFSGSGGFSVTKTGTGMFSIYFQPSLNGYPTVVVSPVSQLCNASAVVSETERPWFFVMTAIDGQQQDIDGFSFIAVCPPV